MGVLFSFLIIALLVYLIFFRILWAITKPLFMYIYDSLVNAFRSLGLKEDAAKAIISLIALIVIAMIFFR